MRKSSPSQYYTGMAQWPQESAIVWEVILDTVYFLHISSTMASNTVLFSGNGRNGGGQWISFEQPVVLTSTGATPGAAFWNDKAEGEGQTAPFG
jgi:hypothetical protein